MEQDFNRSNIRPYFGKKSQKVAIIVAVVGLLFTFILPPLGIILLLVALGLYIKTRFFSDYTGESDVDKAMKFDFEASKQRSLEKLGVVKEQVAVIEPIYITGPVSTIPGTATGSILAQENASGILSRILNRKDTKKSLLENRDDPMWFIKFGSDENLRYTLMRNTAFYFGEEELYIYYEEVDIATGLIYNSGTHEMFYKDIQMISTNQTNTKQFNAKAKKYERIIKEYFSVDMAGTSYSAAFKAYTEGKPSTDNVVDKQIVGMRSLVRDKKMK